MEPVLEPIGPVAGQRGAHRRFGRQGLRRFARSRRPVAARRLRLNRSRLASRSSRIDADTAVTASPVIPWNGITQSSMSSSCGKAAHLRVKLDCDRRDTRADRQRVAVQPCRHIVVQPAKQPHQLRRRVSPRTRWARSGCFIRRTIHSQASRSSPGGMRVDSEKKTTGPRSASMSAVQPCCRSRRQAPRRVVLVFDLELVPAVQVLRPVYKYVRTNSANRDSGRQILVSPQDVHGLRRSRLAQHSRDRLSGPPAFARRGTRHWRAHRRRGRRTHPPAARSTGTGACSPAY